MEPRGWTLWMPLSNNHRLEINIIYLSHCIFVSLYIFANNYRFFISLCIIHFLSLSLSLCHSLPLSVSFSFCNFLLLSLSLSVTFSLCLFFFLALSLSVSLCHLLFLSLSLYLYFTLPLSVSLDPVFKSQCSNSSMGG